MTQLENLLKEYTAKKGKEAYLVAEKIADFLKTYLQTHENDNEIRLKYALSLYATMLHDDIEALEQLKIILASEPHNIKAWLFLAYIEDRLAFIDEKLFLTLCKLKSDDLCTQSMIEYVKSWYYIHNDKKKYEQTLLNSIELCDKHVKNYVALAQVYLQNNRIEEGRHLLQQALNNVKHVYSDHGDDYDILDIDEFLNERIKGIHRSQANYEIILESFDPKSPWITGKFGTHNKN